MPPGRDSGPGGRQPLGKASRQREQEKHQGGAGLWGTVGWAQGPAEVENRVSGLAGGLLQHRAVCTHLTEEGRSAEAPSKTGVQVPNLQQYINSDRKERGELNRLRHLCQAEIPSYSTFRYFLGLRDPAGYELPPCWPPRWPDSLATLRGFQHGRLQASHWAVCYCCSQRCTCVLMPVGPGFRFHGHKEKFRLSQGCQIFFFFDGE